MFAIECPSHGSQVMVPETRIRELRNTTEGILLDVECWCGSRIALRTGRRSSAVRQFGTRAVGRSGREQLVVGVVVGRDP
jgi:hypothetical protein